MFEEIRIQGIGVIDDAVLELSPGLNVVTGETGAGKTMVVSGLGLLLGALLMTVLRLPNKASAAQLAAAREAARPVLGETWVRSSRLPVRAQRARSRP